MVYPYDKFEFISNLIIDNLERGYYHPDFYINGANIEGGGRISAAAFVKADYKRSGETLFGLDRHAGWDMWYKSTRKTSSPQDNLKFIYSGVYQFQDNDAKKFWTTLDNLNARKNWSWGYMGGSNYQMLKALCIKMMYNYFLKNVYNKLNDVGKGLLLTDDKLALNYIYSAWNGLGYSNYYNKVFNNTLKNGITDTTIINNNILTARQNSESGLIRDTAKKLKKVFLKIKSTNTKVVVKKKTNKNILLGSIFTTFLLIYVYKKKFLKF